MCQLLKLSSAMGRRDSETIYATAAKLIVRDPKDTLALNAFAQAALDLGHYDEALQAWEASAEADPANFEALRALAKHAEESGRRAAARQYLERAIDAFPHKPILPPRSVSVLMNVVGLLIGRRGLGTRARVDAERTWQARRRWMDLAVKRCKANGAGLGTRQ